MTDDLNTPCSPSWSAQLKRFNENYILEEVVTNLTNTYHADLSNIQSINNAEDLMQTSGTLIETEYDDAVSTFNVLDSNGKMIVENILSDELEEFILNL